MEILPGRIGDPRGRTDVGEAMYEVKRTKDDNLTYAVFEASVQTFNGFT